MAQTARIETRMDSAIKAKADAELKKHGMSISEFVRMSLTEVATAGLPEYYVTPKLSPTLLASIHEVKDDMEGKIKLPEATNYKELMDMLDD
ncbi:type II toxin-antitoxin system RelB/DinJ family antitoxin [Lactobacillus sp. ESL0681]|uniref:type II toxin-antitoxin system RelB/DinJ family antitoxin n=1 Tax=Lactobacillus sp. ESL0681 TaxID=2983211 RepID=UPI0023F6B9D7|nr:type II toxin-antitoxin system RelB/DinJ family antitoxin [Lactobacillus sp. ESL0681]WEV39978.1 type II toxin-antitoxin system RelB/DinJ family antitoxin [Lactobacillus sp. ESL0681]